MRTTWYHARAKWSNVMTDGVKPYVCSEILLNSYRKSFNHRYTYVQSIIILDSLSTTLYVFSSKWWKVTQLWRRASDTELSTGSLHPKHLRLLYVCQKLQRSGMPSSINSSGLISSFDTDLRDVSRASSKKSYSETTPRKMNSVGNEWQRQSSYTWVHSDELKDVSSRWMVLRHDY